MNRNFDIITKNGFSTKSLKDLDILLQNQDRLEFQRQLENIRKENIHKIWILWTDWYFSNSKDNILMKIGLRSEFFNRWFDENNDKKNIPLSHDFFQVIFDFLYDNHEDITKNKAKHTFHSYLYRIGLDKKASSKCMKNNCSSIDIHLNPFLTSISYVYGNMIEYSYLLYDEETDTKFIEID